MEQNLRTLIYNTVFGYEYTRMFVKIYYSMLLKSTPASSIRSINLKETFRIEPFDDTTMKLQAKPKTFEIPMPYFRS